MHNQEPDLNPPSASPTDSPREAAPHSLPVAARARDVDDEEGPAAHSASWWRMVIGHLVHDGRAMVGLVMLVLVAIVVIFAPLIAQYGPDTINAAALNEGPSWQHWCGTDNLGRDLLSRLLYGGRISVPAGLGVVAIAAGLGIPMGVAAGYGSRFLDDALMRLVDLVLAIPALLLAIGIVSILGPGLESVVIAFGIAFIPSFARVARGTTLQVRALDYVEAARAQGAGNLWTIRKHILPTVFDSLIVLASLNLGSAILATAALSFLGLGTQLPTSDWGTLLSVGYENMFESSSEMIFPGVALVVTVVGINFLGDGLASALNPRVASLRNVGRTN
ncbi:MAG TPA: ABC transporter permease [Chloroflexota bacterium]|nr:ABC transporter permease [Chloroflexota bacterium]